MIYFCKFWGRFLIWSFSYAYCWKTIAATHHLVVILLKFELFWRRCDSNGCIKFQVRQSKSFVKTLKFVNTCCTLIPSNLWLSRIKLCKLFHWVKTTALKQSPTKHNWIFDLYPHDDYDCPWQLIHLLQQSSSPRSLH